MARCLEYSDCYFGPLRSINAGNVCRSRAEWLEAGARNYVALDLVGRQHSRQITAASAREVCGERTTFAAERVCACEQDLYFDVHAKRCAPLPVSFDSEHLLFVLEYEHGGKKLTQRLGLYTTAECTAVSGVGGYVTDGEQSCVRECAGPDRHIVPGTRRCECVAFLDVDRRTCVPRCGQWRYFGTERRCELWCPTELPIVSGTGECTTCATIDSQKPYFVRGRNDCYADCAST